MFVCVSLSVWKTFDWPCFKTRGPFLWNLVTFKPMGRGGVVIESVPIKYLCTFVCKGVFFIPPANKESRIRG